MYTPNLIPMKNEVVGTIIGAAIRRNMARKRTNLAPQETLHEYSLPVYYLHLIPMHAIIQECYEYQAEATRHAVESGVNFSDHMILYPLRFEVEFEVSNADGLGSNARFSADSLEVARQVWEKRELFSLQTTHRLLENVACLGLRVTNAAPEWGKLRFQATFQEIKLVTLQTQRFPSGQVQGAPQVSSSAQSFQSSAQPSGPVTGKSAASPSKAVKRNVQSTVESSLFKPAAPTSSFQYLQNTVMKK